MTYRRTIFLHLVFLLVYFGTRQALLTLDRMMVRTCGYGEAREVKARQDLDFLRSALRLCEEREGRLPASGDMSELVGKYAQELPHDPWGNPYRFDAEGRVLYSVGADGKRGGGFDDADIVLWLDSTRGR